METPSWLFQASVHCCCNESIPVACREAFPAAVVDVGHPSLAEPILEQIEASSSGSAAVCVAGIDGQGVRANYTTPGDIFAGRHIRFHSRIRGLRSGLPALLKLGDCCRRLVSSHGIDVQVAWSIVAIRENCEFARAVKLLVPHLCCRASARRMLGRPTCLEAMPSLMSRRSRLAMAVQATTSLTGSSSNQDRAP